MRRVAALVLALAAPAANADVGIGVSAKTDSATIYVPVTVGRFMLEPYLRATDRENESSATTGGLFPVTLTSASEFEASGVGLGVFRLVAVADRFTLYYGGRLASIDEESTLFTATGFNALPAFSEPSQSTTAEGHSIMPTLGVSFSITERLSIGAEIGVDHAELDTETFNRSQSGTTTQTGTGTITANDTRANVILRFYF
jgi:hypothetical protein